MVWFEVFSPGFVNYYLLFEAEMLNNIDIESFTEVVDVSDFQFLSICCFFANCVSWYCFISPFLMS